MDELEHNDDSELSFSVQPPEGGVATLTLDGELDIAAIERLEEAMAPVLAQRPERLVIELAGLRFADSSAIALWLRWASEVGQIELRNVQPLLGRVIESMGLKQLFGLAS